jgi:hypothetical protein
MPSICLREGCNTQPNCNYEGQTKALYCATHKLDGMVDIKNKRCLNGVIHYPVINMKDIVCTAIYICFLINQFPEIIKLKKPLLCIL